MFELQMGKSIEVYIDNMVVKSKLVSEHLRDLGDIFEVLNNRPFFYCCLLIFCDFVERLSPFSVAKVV